MPKKTSFRFARVPNFKWAGSYYTAFLVTYPDKSTWTSSEFMIEVAPGAESTQSN
ncbi:hypothetical protein IV58_GL000487 [Lactobacillus delbrueckii subsp. jakobsenii ZN7a-9 = DSM 26046]|uniref:hypothetical protein n=1 Tax=Lactobacillus delbrueckii TaxID=1584 RepID=UPI00032D9F15|nr:hypothetical protein [Lactobacillus delbrueckii]EOD02051.1 hypothetical protein B506_08408 [Lactobacillus delbrueckii subsp. jakobsenii ZN7a-9 = DSM 26046]KRO17795.1 hypothetical protein IV58_GL000487 [Lactobacillus delbrueckii subsp. jakobsenii ZN7a-9 = DSM 26046]